MYQRFESGIAGFRSNTAHRLLLKSAARAVRSVICVKASVKPVRAAISSRISGKSTRGSLVATASRKAKSDGWRFFQVIETDNEAP